MMLSIIVPSFNQGRFLAQTLDSILSQAYRPLEVIVVDGCSTDDTVAILKDYAARHPELRWLSEKDSGPADAVNKGLALASGDFAAIQSADDLYVPQAFTAVMQAFVEHPDHGFLIGHYQGIDARGRILYTQRMPAFSWEAYFGMALCIPQSSIFFRLGVARAAGGWNPAYFGCDLDYWLRLLLRTKALRLDRVLSCWRLHAGGRTHRGHQREIWDGYWRMIADNRELASAPAHVQRLARASRHILALRFHPTGNPWAVRWHALVALAQHPTFWRWQDRRALARLVPGYGALRWVRHAAKRVLGLPRQIYRLYLNRRRRLRVPSVRLLEAFARAYPGASFVQVGANDGVALDPLRRLILQKPWRGVLVEPVPYVFQRLRQNHAPRLSRLRLENVAVAGVDGDLPFYHLARVDDPVAEGLPFWYDQLGSFRREVVLGHAHTIPDIADRVIETRVPCVTFDTLCRRNGMEQLDLLHLDTEGYDYELLKTIDLERYRPRLLVYEHQHLGEAQRLECSKLLARHGYECFEENMDSWCLRVSDVGPRDAPLLECWQDIKILAPGAWQRLPLLPPPLALLRRAAWWFRTPPAAPHSESVGAQFRPGARTLHLACAADEKYLPHCAAMLHSALSHLDGLSAEVHFLHEPGLPAAQIGRLRALCESRGAGFDPLAVPNEMIEGLHATRHIARTAWYRTFLPALRPDLDRALYLDCDTLVVNSLKPLWETPLDGVFVAVVRNVIASELATRHHALELPPGQVYFNSGVMLMNLALMREQGCIERIVAHGRRHERKLIWADQDSLNLVYGANCRFLHPRWNCQTSLFLWPEAEGVFGAEVVAEAVSDPAIIHFEGPGPSKPWNYLCKHPYRRRYYEHLTAAGWEAPPEEGRDWRRAAIRLLPMRIGPHALQLARRLRARFA